MPLTDTVPDERIAIADVDGVRYIVTPQRYSQEFSDGTMLFLHCVRRPQDRRPSTFLRAVYTEGAWNLFDLRHLAGKLDSELPNLPPPSQHGVVFYTLRRMCFTAAELVNLVRSNCLARARPLRSFTDDAWLTDTQPAGRLA